jgi:hypothetical protein
MEPEADRFGKANGFGVVCFRAEGRVLFGRGHFLDGYESLDEGSGKLIGLQQTQTLGDPREGHRSFVPESHCNPDLARIAFATPLQV